MIRTIEKQRFTILNGCTEKESIRTREEGNDGDRLRAEK